MFSVCGTYLKMDTRKKFVGSLCKCSLIVITAGMLLYHRGLWSLPLSLPVMLLFKMNTHYIDSYSGTGYYST